jgi:hypothetical protein
MLRHIVTRVLFLGVLFTGVLGLSACDMSRGLIEDLTASAPDAPTMVQIPRTLLVLPLAGASPTIGHELANKIAWGLREAGYPARTANVADGVNPVLAGWIEEASSGGDVIWLDFEWAVYGPSGKLAGTHREEMAVSRFGWDSLSNDTLGIIVTESVPAIHEMVEGKIPLDDRIALVSSTQTNPSFTEGGFEAETIIVSSEGLSRVTDDGEEIVEHSEIALAPPPSNNDGIAVEVTGEVTLATPEPLEDPVVKINTISADDLPDGTLSGIVLPSVADIQQPPDQPLGTVEVAAPTDTPMGLDPALDEFEPAPDLLPDDVDVLTPESAALVTTAPELTMAEQPAPVPEIAQTPDMVESVPQPSPEPMVASSPTPGVDGLPDYAAPQTGTQVAGSPSSAALNRARITGQPVFLVHKAIGAPGDGNLTLPLALQQALREADAAITSDPTIASHVIQCSVLVETPFAGRQRTRIVWTVTDIMGQETGSAIQENDVPQGSLDQSWVPVAPVIARAAVKGIRKLFVNGIEQHGIGGGLSQPDLPHIQSPG